MLGICTNNFIIPPTDAELMGRCRRKRWIYSHPCLEASPKENLILTHYMLTAWWIKCLDGLGNYIIFPGSMEQLLVMTTNLNTLGYTYATRRLKKPPDILGILQRITHPLYPRERHRMPRHHMTFSRTNNQ